MHYWLVVPAAGSGSRFSAAELKQYTLLEGQRVIEWALQPFVSDARCRGISLAIGTGDRLWPEVEARVRQQRAAQQPGTQFPILHTTGGRERAHSVRNALSMLEAAAAADDWVLVHDAARPCVTRPEIDALLQACAAYPDGGLLAIAVADTLKREAEQPGRVGSTLPRDSLWRALTPQMFRYAALCQALDHALTAGRLPTDEAQALEWRGVNPLLVTGSSRNLKITGADDLELARAILRARNEVRA